MNSRENLHLDRLLREVWKTPAKCKLIFSFGFYSFYFDKKEFQDKMKRRMKEKIFKLP